MSSITGVNDTIAALKRVVSARRAKKIVDDLAEIGKQTAKGLYDIADYDGDRDTVVDVKGIKGGKAVVASGESVLFIEYGSGLIGYGHPEPLQYGPGTWSDSEKGKHHWNDPNGWHIPGTGQRTYGNPPAMAMYQAGKEIKRNIPRVVRESFR